jgi:transposase
VPAALCVLGDRGYDAAAVRHGLRAGHILPLLAMRRTKHGSGLGPWRWAVERTFAWLNQFRRLRARYDKRADTTKPSSRSAASGFAGGRCAEAG